MVNAAAVQALDCLLQQAMASAEIKEINRNVPISTREYLSLMASLRHSPDPNQRFAAAMCQPEIQDTATQELLLNVIRNALGPYIHNDMLQSATIATGGFEDGFHINELMSHLLTIAIVRGSEYAAKNFYECAEKTSVKLQSITLIDGITIENTTEISDGIRLVPIPNNFNDLPPYINILPLEHYTKYFGRTLLIIDELISPVFANPGAISPEGTTLPFRRSNVNPEFPNFTPHEFCEALSLSTNHVVEDMAWWSYIHPDEAYAVRSTFGSQSYDPSRLHHTHSRIEVDKRVIQEAMSLYSTLKGLDSDISHKLRVPIDRWIRSKKENNPVDAFINLGTALESLYLESGSTGELTFRLALRAAWLLRNDAQERISLKREFVEIYRLRSKAVHNGILKETEATPEFRARAQDLCLESIIKIIESGEFPDWDKLVMGML